MHDVFAEVAGVSCLQVRGGHSVVTVAAAEMQIPVQQYWLF